MRGRNHRRAVPRRTVHRFAEEAARRIARHLPIHKVILFGSYAYGRPTYDSDLDLLVVAKKPGDALRRAVSLSMLIPDRPVGIDFIVVTPAEIRRRIAGFDPFLEEALGKGIVVYPKAR